MKVRLRPARNRDSRAIGRILSDWLDATDWMPRIHSRDDDQGFARQLIETAEVTVATRLGRPVGFLARRDDYVHALYLAAGNRGKGIGRRLVDEAKATTDRLTLWTFRDNAAARAFYARLGFAEVEEGDGTGNDEGLPDVRLEWRRDE